MIDALCPKGQGAFLRRNRMICKPIDVLTNYEIRKTKKQKSAFISAVSDYIRTQRYDVKIEKGSFGLRNIVVGDPEKAEYLVTAHYDTPASIGLPNLITPCNPVTYFLFQFLIVGLLLGISVSIAFAVKFLTNDTRFALLSWYIAYFGILGLMMFGPANRHNANDNTSGVVTVLEMMHSMPDNLRDKVCFVLFDLEEAGLVGSGSYRKLHKDAIERQIMLNLDCVGDGDVIQFAPVKNAKKDDAILKKLEGICGKVGSKELRLRARGFTVGPSDHKNFPNGIGIMAFRYQKGIGLYCGRIHTYRDTILDQTNVNILRAALISLIGSADK